MGCVNSASRNLKERCNQLEDRTRNLEENLSDLTMSRVVVKVNLIEGVEEEEEGRVVVNYQGGKVLDQDQSRLCCVEKNVHFFGNCPGHRQKQSEADHHLLGGEQGGDQECRPAAGFYFMTE